MAFQSAETIIAGFKEYLVSAQGERARYLMGLAPGEPLDGFEATVVDNVKHYLTWVTLDFIRKVAVDRSTAAGFIPQGIREKALDYIPVGVSFSALAVYLLHVHQKEHEYNED